MHALSRRCTTQKIVFVSGLGLACSMSMSRGLVSALGGVEGASSAAGAALQRAIHSPPDPSAVAVDAFRFLLKGENPYCFPPVSCIPQLLREVLRQQVTITLVAPDWQAAWRPDLNRLLLEPPLRLPSDSIRGTGATLPHLSLTCFRISGSYSRLSAAHKALSNRW